MKTEATTQTIGTGGRTRSTLLLSLALGAALAALVALAALSGTAREAQAAFSEKIVFASNRAAGKGVNNPTGDREIESNHRRSAGAELIRCRVGRRTHRDRRSVRGSRALQGRSTR